MTTAEGLMRQRRGDGPAHVIGSGSGRPLARRLLGPFRRTHGAFVAGLILWCTGLVGVAGATTITEFATPTAFSVPVDITAGPDGALWFTEAVANKIGRITTAGTPHRRAVWLNAFHREAVSFNTSYGTCRALQILE